MTRAIWRAWLSVRSDAGRLRQLLEVVLSALARRSPPSTVSGRSLRTQTRCRWRTLDRRCHWRSRAAASWAVGRSWGLVYADLSQLPFDVRQADDKVVWDDVWQWWCTVFVQRVEVSGHALEKAIRTVCQRLHVAVMQLISEPNQRLSCVDCLTRNVFDATPPGAWVAGAQTLHLPGVVLPSQRPRHPLYAVVVRLVYRAVWPVFSAC